MKTTCNSLLVRNVHWRRVASVACSAVSITGRFVASAERLYIFPTATRRTGRFIMSTGSWVMSSGCLVETCSGWCSFLSSATSELVEGSGKADGVKMYSNHYFFESETS